MVTVLLEIVAVVAGLKSEYFTSGLEQPATSKPRPRSRVVTNRFTV
jgi:hypothetical protein